MDNVSFTIVTGLSGAGKTQAMKVLEDLDFFCIDNLPPALLPRLVELHAHSDEKRKYAIAIDIRVREYFSDLRKSLEWLENSGYNHHLLFLDCNDQVLIRRFSETRRIHPLTKEQTTPESIQASIISERKLLSDARSMAHDIIDTTDLRPMDLRLRLIEIYQEGPHHQTITVDIFSFGYKYGVPIDADIVFDVRFIPNPFYVDELRPLTGREKAVSDYVMQFPVAQVFIDKLSELIEELLPAYSREGKARLTIGIGCTGGQHRSVATSIVLKNRLLANNIHTTVRHREIAGSKLLVEVIDGESS